MLNALSPEKIWLIIGFFAQALFASRFVVQWIATERARASVIPISFWYISLVGAGLLLAYAIYKKDPVFILGQSTGAIVYVRNLYFIHRTNARSAEAGI